MDPEHADRHRQHVAALLAADLPSYTVVGWPGEVMVGGSSASEDAIHEVEMLHTDDRVRPRAWVRVRTVSDASRRAHGLSGATYRLAGQLQVREHPPEGSDPSPRIDEIHGQLLAAPRDAIRIVVDGDDVDATQVTDPDSGAWVVHAVRDGYELVLTGEHADAGALALAVVPDLGPYLPPPWRAHVPGGGPGRG